MMRVAQQSGETINDMPADWNASLIRSLSLIGVRR